MNNKADSKGNYIQDYCKNLSSNTLNPLFHFWFFDSANELYAEDGSYISKAPESNDQLTQRFARFWSFIFMKFC